jgi:hypothetical protein
MRGRWKQHACLRQQFSDDKHYLVIRLDSLIVERFCKIDAQTQGCSNCKAEMHSFVGCFDV